MNFLAYCRNKLREENGFSLLEIIIVISISSLLTVVFVQLINDLYQKNKFFSLENAWQLDVYLIVDFIADQIKNSVTVEIINENEIDLFSYYDEEYQWLKFNSYQVDEVTNLGRRIGSSDYKVKSFKRKDSLLKGIEEIKFEIINPGLLKISLSVKEQNEKLTVSRLVKI